MKDGDHASGATPTDDFAVDPLRVIDPVTLEGTATFRSGRWLLEPWIPIGSVCAIYGDSASRQVAFGAATYDGLRERQAIPQYG